MAKQAYEMLPGCATVVLETVLAIQAFAGSLSSPSEPEVVTGLQAAYKTVASLTAWADSVILGDTVSADQVDQVVEPVRCAVIVLVNLIAVRVGGSALGRGSSLPDITSAEGDDDGGLATSHSSDSILELGLQKPPLLPRLSAPPDSAPPLPPKLARPRFDRSFEDLLAQSYSLQTRALGDWAPPSHRTKAPPAHRTRKGGLDRSLPSPQGLDTTLPDLEPIVMARDYMDEVDGPVRNNSMHSPFSWSSRDRSNTSSPSLETLSFSSHLSEDPPAIPRKARLSTPDPSRPFPTRKMSQYDNLPHDEAHSLRRVYDSEGSRLLQMVRSDSFPISSPGPGSNSWARARARGPGGQEAPPPLPPKKRNIMSYMEMFGKSIIPNGEDLLQGLFHPHDLLHNVWQQNFHEYSEYAPSSLLSFPLADHQLQPTELTHPYMNLQIDGALDLPPPALPPKRSSRSHPGSFRSEGWYQRSLPPHRPDPQEVWRGSESSPSSGSRPPPAPPG